MTSLEVQLHEKNHLIALFPWFFSPLFPLSLWSSQSVLVYSSLPLPILVEIPSSLSNGLDSAALAETMYTVEQDIIIIKNNAQPIL